MTVKKLCCLGLGQAGVPLCAVIASKCPEIRVTVVHTNQELIFLWNTKQIPSSVNAPGLEELIRKCQNKNLFFTTNDESSIKDADVIFIISESKLKTCGDGEDKALDLSMVEDAAHLIAEYSESDKIVVENSAIPMKTAECVRMVLKNNGKPGVKFQVLSNPEFYEEGSALQNLLFPGRILIGREDTPEGYAAARELSYIYERWVLPQNILTSSVWNAELSKICSSAFIAQRIANIYAFSAICEESGGNIADIIEILSKEFKIEYIHLDPCLSGGNFPKLLSNLIYLCESLNLPEVADFWKQVLLLNNYHWERFFKRLLWTLNQTVRGRRIAILGYAYYKDSNVTTGSPSVNFCRYLIDEGATVCIYDPKVTKSQVIEDLTSTQKTHDTLPNFDRSVFVYDDPYRATFQTQVIVICASWPEFTHLDFRRIFAEMTKPAYMFDTGNILDHSKLSLIGFKTYCVGKAIKNPENISLSEIETRN